MARVKKAKQKKKILSGWEDLLEQFLCWKQAEGRSSLTLRDYQDHVSRFFKRHPQSLKQDVNDK